MVAVDSQRLILNALHSDLHLRQRLNLREYGVIGRYRLTLHRHNLQLRVEGGEEGGHHIVKTVEHGECDHESHRGNRHTHDGNGTDDVDGVGGLLGEEIPAGYKEREIHVFRSSSMRSI